MEAVAEITAAVKNVPALRFPEFEEEWVLKRFGDITKRISDAVKVEEDKLYQQIGIRSHGKGLFHKEFVDGKSLGNKRVFWVKEDAFIVNIVFAWEQAVGKTTSAESGMIASHRFPMYLPVKNQSNLNYLLYFFLTKRGKFLLELASPGGAGRNKTLGQKEFENLKFLIPTYTEQQKIASFLSAVDDKIQQLSKKKALLEKYKKGVMQQIFSQQIRFKDDKGNDFPEWEEKRLGEIASFYKGKGLPKSDIIESGKYRCIHYGELFTKYYELIGEIISRTNAFDKPFLSVANDVLMPTSDVTPNGLATASCLMESGVILGGDVLIIRQKKQILNGLFLAYFIKQYKHKVMRLVSGSTVFHLYGSDMGTVKVVIPSLKEQSKIAIFLTSIDNKINYTSKQLEKAQQFKKGLLQQMFV